MSEIKKEYAYRTTDGKLHSGENAVRKAKDHQRRVDFRKTINDMLPTAEEIFGLKDIHDDDDGDTDETLLIEKINEFLLYEFDDLEDLVCRFVDLQMEIPEFAKFLALIEKRFEKIK